MPHVAHPQMGQAGMGGKRLTGHVFSRGISPSRLFPAPFGRCFLSLCRAAAVVPRPIGEVLIEAATSYILAKLVIP